MTVPPAESDVVGPEVSELATDTDSTVDPSVDVLVESDELDVVDDEPFAADSVRLGAEPPQALSASSPRIVNTLTCRPETERDKSLMLTKTFGRRLNDAIQLRRAVEAPLPRRALRVAFLHMAATIPGC